MVRGIIAIIVNSALVKATNDTKENGENDELAYDAEIFDEKEFEYFYNMELLEKLELIANNESDIGTSVGAFPDAERSGKNFGPLCGAKRELSYHCFQ